MHEIVTRETEREDTPEEDGVALFSVESAANFQGNSINTRGFVPLRINNSSSFSVLHIKTDRFFMRRIPHSKSLAYAILGEFGTNSYLGLFGIFLLQTVRSEKVKFR